MKATWRDLWDIADRAVRVKEAALIILIIYDVLISAAAYALTFTAPVENGVYVWPRSWWAILAHSGQTLAALGSVSSGDRAAAKTRFVHLFFGVIAIGADGYVTYQRVNAAIECGDQQLDSCVFKDASVYLDWVGAFVTLLLVFLAVSGVALAWSKERFQHERAEVQTAMEMQVEADEAAVVVPPPRDAPSAAAMYTAYRTPEPESFSAAVVPPAQLRARNASARLSF